jgi:thymidylate synthase
MLEIVSASFVADENYIFGKPNDDYISREINWYMSQSLSVLDLGEPVPKIWMDVSTKDGKHEINSNYGYLLFSQQNYNQYQNVKDELKANPFSRRAVAVYTRPSIWQEFNRAGMSDFICTNAVQYLIRDNKLTCVVQMRSNDAWAGYRNDYAWQLFVLRQLAVDLNVEVGDIHWHAGSLHMYERNFKLIEDHYELA